MGHIYTEVKECDERQAQPEVTKEEEEEEIKVENGGEEKRGRKR